VSITITCIGCGQSFELPDDFPRRKVRCAACGVYSEVPEAPRKAPPRPKIKQSPPPAAKQTVQSSAPPASTAPVFEDGYRGDAVARPVAKLPANADPLPKLPTGMPKGKPLVEDQDDGAMYHFADPDNIRCPDCQKELPHNVMLCHHCGFNLETRKRPVKVYEELHKTWEAGWPFARRLNSFIICQAIVLPMDLVGAVSTANWGGFLTPWLFFTLLLAFVLGTYDRLDLTRDKRGRVKLSRTWRFFFFARPPEAIDLRNYEGVTTGPAGKNMMDWVVCLVLLPSVFLAALWWIYVVNAPGFHVSLTQNHGYPEAPLYRGSNQERAREIAGTLHEVAGLPYSG
jgi:hypothetical protein